MGLAGWLLGRQLNLERYIPFRWDGGPLPSSGGKKSPHYWSVHLRCVLSPPSLTGPQVEESKERQTDRYTQKETDRGEWFHNTPNTSCSTIITVLEKCRLLVLNSVAVIKCKSTNHWWLNSSPKRDACESGAPEKGKNLFLSGCVPIINVSRQNNAELIFRITNWGQRDGFHLPFGGL